MVCIFSARVSKNARNNEMSGESSGLSTGCQMILWVGKQKLGMNAFDLRGSFFIMNQFIYFSKMFKVFVVLNYFNKCNIFTEHARKALELSKLQESTKQQEVSRYHFIYVPL